MEAVPENIDLLKVSNDIRKISSVKEVHDLHIWSIASDVYALSAHVLIDTKDVNSLNKIITEINDMLKSTYNITHTVIQTECEQCANTEGTCDRNTCFKP
jgi:cobalt-zinc-cadmium efflux system protein